MSCHIPHTILFYQYIKVVTISINISLLYLLLYHYSTVDSIPGTLKPLSKYLSTNMNIFNGLMLILSNEEVG